MINPDLHNRINRDLEERKVLFILCNCGIEYFGRSRSVIGLGHRLVIIKKDSTLLVHSVTGYKPVNWMNAPTETLAEMDGEDLVLHSQRTKKPFEEMKLRIMDVVDYNSYTDIVDNEKLDLTHTEQDMQDYLVKNPKLIHPDFRLISTEHQTPLGYLDLYGKIGETYTVVELKVERAGLPAALQIKRYKEWMESFIGKAQGILIAPGITPNALQILKKEKIEFKKMSIAHLQIKHRKDKTLKEWFD